MKRFFKVIAVFMVVILCGGLLSTFFDFGSDEPTGPGTIVQRPSVEDNETEEPDVPEEPSCTHVDADDNELCDLCGETFSDGIEAIFGGVELSNIDFSESYRFSAQDTNRIVPGVVTDIKYGVLTTQDGYLNFYTEEVDEVYNSDNYFGFYMLDESSASNVVPLDIGTLDYFTIDFDMWSDKACFSSMLMLFYGADENGSTSLSVAPHLNLVSDGSETYLAKSTSNYESIYSISDVSQPIHITYAVEINHEDISASKVRIYVNGEFLTDSLNAFNDFASIKYFRLYMSSHQVEADKSICFDNVQIYSFGEGNGDYAGTITELFESTETNLTECVDSVLYKKK